MGIRTVSAAAPDPALAVPPHPGHPRRDLGAHRDLPVDPEPEPETTAPDSRPAVTTPRAAYGAAEAAEAWDRRRRELEHLAGITEVLTDVERRADELNRRAAELVDGWLP